MAATYPVTFRGRAYLQLRLEGTFLLSQLNPNHGQRRLTFPNLYLISRSLHV